MADEERLEGGWASDVRRRGDVVLRDAGPHSRTVIRLLRHLDDQGFDAAPVPVGDGFADDGREVLTYIEGESPQPAVWNDEAAHRVGELVAALHDAAAGFDPGPDAVWAPWFARDLPGRRPVIGHGDLGPWNILAREGRPVAFIDWDTAGPVDALWELAEVCWLNSQLHDDDVGAAQSLPSPAERAAQCRLILDGYGLPRADRDGFVDMMIEFAVRSARDEAVQRPVEQDTASPAPDGYPLLWAVTWRTRAAAWMLDHRPMLQRAITA